MKKKTELTANSEIDILEVLRIRFEQNMHRHKGISWPHVLERLLQQPSSVATLQKMENTGGEPDVTGIDETTGRYVYTDCSAETPSGRRNLCYDRAALDARKEFKPANSAIDVANDMGISILDEAAYRHLQTLEPFDCKTSSWLYTPDAIRKHGGALFGDRRYHHVFVYHNGAQSYYAVRGFRGNLFV